MWWILGAVALWVIVSEIQEWRRAREVQEWRREVEALRRKHYPTDDPLGLMRFDEKVDRIRRRRPPAELMDRDRYR
jgi:hypothetical protein